MGTNPFRCVRDAIGTRPGAASNSEVLPTFSSEYTDDEAGLVYYGHRFYWQELGRWTARDPVFDGGRVFEDNVPLVSIPSSTLQGEELAYVFAGNDACNQFDAFGLVEFTYERAQNCNAGNRFSYLWGYWHEPEIIDMPPERGVGNVVNVDHRCGQRLRNVGGNMCNTETHEVIWITTEQCCRYEVFCSVNYALRLKGHEVSFNVTIGLLGRPEEEWRIDELTLVNGVYTLQKARAFSVDLGPNEVNLRLFTVNPSVTWSGALRHRPSVLFERFKMECEAKCVER